MSQRSSLRPFEAPSFLAHPPRHPAAGGLPLALSNLRRTALTTWVPTWWSLFHDPRCGGFYERLHADGTPQAGLPRRLLTQCRQLYVYSHATLACAAGLDTQDLGRPVGPGDSTRLSSGVASRSGRGDHSGDSGSGVASRSGRDDRLRDSGSGIASRSGRGDHLGHWGWPPAVPWPAGALQRELAHLQACYRVATTGGWRFSATAEGLPHSDTYDLYGHAFVLLTLAYTFRATQERDCLLWARQTLSFMRRHFAAPHGGYHEQLDPQLRPAPSIRRQNPHMHLFEACLAFEHPAVAEADDALQAEFAREADGLFALFAERFWHPASGTLIEHLTCDLAAPHPLRGHELEPGHHYEWALLLQQYAARRPEHAPQARAIARQLHAWAEAHALHPDHGAVVNLLHRSNRQVLDPNHRIWHIAEALRAAIALGEDAAPWARLLSEFVQEDGRWTEVLDPTLQPALDAMPGTTPYHLLGAALVEP